MIKVFGMGLLSLIGLTLLGACCSEDTKAAAEGGSEPELKARIEHYAPTIIDTDRSSLPASEQAALEKIISAARQLDEVFYRQAYAGNPAVLARLQNDRSPEGRQRLLYFSMMKGPWDRGQEGEPFAVDIEHPAGAGYYPTDMSREEFAAACKGSEEAAKKLRSLYTLVQRGADGSLVSVPYSQAFKTWLEPAAADLEAAAALTQNLSLRRFLRSRAQAFRDDDYYQSDKDWMDLDGRVEVTIGPYEVYEDKLLGLKASFEAFVTLVDPQASIDLARYKSELAEMERMLPVPDQYKTTRGRESPIRVADLVFAAGDARTNVQTLAFNLPNDERVRAEKGAKKVLLANVIREKFNQIMVPIGKRVLAQEQIPYLSGDAFFNQTLFHELSHSMGPAYVKGDAEGVEIRVRLGDSYSAIEEAKADVMGACNVLYQIRKGNFPAGYRKKHLSSYFLGLFRSVRFGLAEAHGKGAALQINSYIADAAATWDPQTARLRVDFDALEASIAKLLTEILEVQFEGEIEAARALLRDKAGPSKVIEAVLGRLDGIPIDLRPIYPAAGETR